MSAETNAPEEKISFLTRAMLAVENAKPSNKDDETRKTVANRIKIGAAFATGVLGTVAVVSLKAYYDAVNKAAEEAKEILLDEDTVTED